MERIDENRIRKIRHASLSLLFDAIAAALLLWLFMTLNHGVARPSSNAGMVIVDLAQTDAPHAATVQPTAEPSTERAISQATEPVTATPEPIRAGDFSATFPTHNTGVNALHSYQSDDLRISITQAEQFESTYYIADIWVRDISFFRTALAKGTFGSGIHEGTLTQANNASAVLAISGDYYGARAKGVVVRNGVLYRSTVLNDIAVLYQDGELDTIAKAEFDLASMVSRKAYQAWSFGPALIVDGKPIETPSDSYSDAIWRKNPRCGIGYYAPGHYIVIVADGRQAGYSVGLTLDEFATIFYNLGCVKAYNLDGGQTAMMLFDGQVVNKPYRGGRQVSDIIYWSDKLAVPDEGREIE